MRRSYVVPMRWMVIYEYAVTGVALNLKSTNYPDHGRHGDLPLQGKKIFPWQNREPNPGPHDQ
jgi:hypothetical protein